MRDRHHPRLCGCGAPMACAEDACWRCATPWADRGPRATPAATRPRLRPDHGGRQHEPRVESAVGGGGAHAGTARTRPVAATTAERGLSRAAGAAPSVLRRPAPGVVREGSSGPTPLFTRHTPGVIEAERDRRRQRRAHGAIAHPGTTRGRAASASLGRIATAVAGDARAVAQARLDLDRWVDEGGRVPFEAAALLRTTTSRR
jgi:hypothetical protein